MEQKTRVLTLGEAAEKLRLSKPTIIKLLKNGGIPGFRVGHMWRVDAAGVEAMMRGGGYEKTASRPTTLRAG